MASANLSPITDDSGKKKQVSSNLNQVIDVIQEDISGSATRRKYQTFVTGGIGPGVTSSLYQTIYDQDFTLQTANPVLDMTVGLFHYDNGNDVRPNLVTIQEGTGYQRSDTTEQISFDSKATMMMREKVNVYRQYAQYLLGDANMAFTLETDSAKGRFPSSRTIIDKGTSGNEATVMTTNSSIIDAALFLNVKRLFNRDGIRKETFAIRLYKNAPAWDTNSSLFSNGNITYAYDYTTAGATNANSPARSPKNNILGTSVASSECGVQIIADINANQGQNNNSGGYGTVGILRLAADTTKKVGLIFYEAGIVVLNLGGSSLLSSVSGGTASAQNTANRVDIGFGHDQSTIQAVFQQNDPVFGIVAGMDDGAGTEQNSIGAKQEGQVYVGTGLMEAAGPTVSARSDVGGQSRGPATFYPDLLVSASIDDIIDHIGYTRFSSGSLTGMAFQNTTKIESTIFFCRGEADKFNCSNNTTWKKTDGSNQGVMIQSDGDIPFTYITTVLLYGDDSDKPVAIAKLNRPIEKNEESEVTIRVRLDF